ncbi:MAG: uridine kinase [Candidatus Marinimicrobia bacterium]|nr:uridine kinase [Candidatus Neomarinimicrobiota bacterium]
MADKGKEKPLLIGIAGGTGSGKTLVSNRIYEELGSKQVAIIEQDSYYRDHSDIPIDDRNNRNFDHPNAFDFELMRHQIKKLMEGRAVKVPVYDYKTHTRKKQRRTVKDHVVIILEGILTLFDPGIRAMMDIKVYIDTPSDTRFIRRLNRDTNERGRDIDSVVKQYQESVRPMHEQFVEPTKAYADIIIPGGGYNNVAVDLLKTKVSSLLTERKNKVKKSGK